jgi:hypothetical protein
VSCQRYRKNVELEKLYNPHLYSATKAYIPKAIQLIVEVASGGNGSSELTEETFLFARLASAQQLAGLPEILCVCYRSFG